MENEYNELLESLKTEASQRKESNKLALYLAIIKAKKGLILCILLSLICTITGFIYIINSIINLLINL